MAEGRVLVDARACRPAEPLTIGSKVVVRPDAGRTSDVVPDPSVRVDIVYEDDDVLVLDKPAGMVVHPAKGHWEGTLVHGLLALGSVAGDAEAPLRPGIVHRLDAGTTGLLVVAKNAVARERLKAQFAAHTIEREYVAIVAGEAHEARIEAPHGRHPKDRLRFTSLGRPVGAKVAVTHVRVLERLEGATLVACRLETGRTHQIRVHLLERMQTPILGDPVYGRRPARPSVARVAAQLGRQALHARTLGFDHPRSNVRVRFESPLPGDMQRALEALRRS